MVKWECSKATDGAREQFGKLRAMHDALCCQRTAARRAPSAAFFRSHDHSLAPSPHVIYIFHRFPYPMQHLATVSNLPPALSAASASQSRPSPLRQSHRLPLTDR